MKTITVVGIIPATNADSAIDNLVEAGFDENNISLIMSDEALSRRIVDPGGPLATATPRSLESRLVELGFSQATELVAKPSSDSAVIAVTAPETSVAAAREMLTDAGASQVESA